MLVEPVLKCNQNSAMKEDIRPDTPQPCPVARSLDVIGDRWSLLIVRDAFDGISRFGDFQRSLGAARNILADRWSLLMVRVAFGGISRFGVSQRGWGAARNTLAARLRRLVEAGILKPRPAAEGSAYLEYVLTAQGLELFPVIVALRQWGEGH